MCMQFVLQNSLTLLVVGGKIPQNKHKEHQNMHFGNSLVESQKRINLIILTKSSERHRGSQVSTRAPGAPAVLWTVTCAGSDGVHAWERHHLLLLQNKWGSMPKMPAHV